MKNAYPTPVEPGRSSYPISLHRLIAPPHRTAVLHVCFFSFPNSRVDCWTLADDDLKLSPSGDVGEPVFFFGGFGGGTDRFALLSLLLLLLLLPPPPPLPPLLPLLLLFSAGVDAHANARVLFAATTRRAAALNRLLLLCGAVPALTFVRGGDGDPGNPGDPVEAPRGRGDTPLLPSSGDCASFVPSHVLSLAPSFDLSFALSSFFLSFNPSLVPFVSLASLASLAPSVLVGRGEVRPPTSGLCGVPLLPPGDPVCASGISSGISRGVGVHVDRCHRNVSGRTKSPCFGLHVK